MTGVEVGVLVAIAAASAVASAASTAMAAQAAKEQGEFNAAVAEEEAEFARATAEFEKDRLERRERVFKGAQIARAAGMGLALEGSPLLAINETAEQSELDRIAIDTSASAEEASKRAEAAMARFTGRTKQITGFVQAGSTLLSGASTAGLELQDQ